MLLIHLVLLLKALKLLNTTLKRLLSILQQLHIIHSWQILKKQTKQMLSLLSSLHQRSQLWLLDLQPQQFQLLTLECNIGVELNNKISGTRRLQVCSHIIQIMFLEMQHKLLVVLVDGVTGLFQDLLVVITKLVLISFLTPSVCSELHNLLLLTLEEVTSRAG